MTNAARVAIALGTAGAASLLGAAGCYCIQRWRRKDPAELERLRRLDVNRHGRISSGRILDLVEAPEGAPEALMVIYQYEVSGVTYEAAQDVAPLPEVASHAAHLPGQIVSVKYDTKHPMNSIVVCENWSGLFEPMGERGIAVLKDEDPVAK